MAKKYPRILHIPLTTEQHQVIEREAAERETSVASIGRIAITAYVRNQQKQAEELVGA